MKSTHDFDCAVIGGGSAGYAAARTLKSHGLKTVVIEGGEEVGGLCILRGCMPTKALLYAAEVLHLASHPEPWGIRTDGVGFDFAKVMGRKNQLIKEFADYREKQLHNGGFDLIRATARFLDPHTLELSTGGKLTAESFAISTGSVIAPAPLPSLNEAGYLTSDSALKLTRLPRSVIVLGGGAVALEFAQFFSRFGVKTTLIQRGPHVLTHLDADAASELEAALRDEGISVYTGTKLLGARHLGGLKEVTFEHAGKNEQILAEEIFFALGRVPNVGSLGLENAGVQLVNGRIETNLRMQTSAKHIFAGGDCASPYEVVHIAVQQGEIAAQNIAKPDRPKEMDYRLITEVVFTDPQVATVGLQEKELRERSIPCLTASYPFNDHGKSLIMDVKRGFVKLIASPQTGEILGGTCVGPSGGELIHEIVVAMVSRMKVQDLATTPHYHPTLAEIWTYPAEEIAGKIN